MHEYDCTRCGKKILLPVELDRSRPIYCETCIEIVRAERRSGKTVDGSVAPTKTAEAPKIEESPKLAETEVIQKPVGESVSLSSLKTAEPKMAQPARQENKGGATTPRNEGSEDGEEEDEGEDEEGDEEEEK